MLLSMHGATLIPHVFNSVQLEQYFGVPHCDVCMYVCIYLPLYVFVPVCAYVCMSPCTHACVKRGFSLWLHIYIYSLWAREKPENVHSRGKNKLPKYVCRYRHVHACFSGKNSCIAQNTCLGPRGNFNVLDVFCKFNPDTNLETTFQQKS